jgi:hypothetical protein
MTGNTMKTLTVLALTLLAATSWTANTLAQNAESLLGRIPEAANFVAVVNNRAILQSPRGVREGWAKKNEMEYLEGAIPIPPTVTLMVMGSQVDAGNLIGNWGLGVFTLNKRMSMKQIAERHGGVVEKFGDWEAASTHHGFIVELLNGVYGLMINGNRQDFARWVKNFGASRKPQVNDYLKQVIADAKSDHVAAAFDLEDTVDPVKLRARLAMLKSLAGKSREEIAGMEKLLASTKGLRISATIGDQSRTVLRIDFKSEIGDSKELLKPCLLELVASMGARLEEFEKAEWQFESRAVVVQADLNDGSFARLMTIALLPMHASDPSVSTTPNGVQSEIELIATRRYYLAIATLLDDLERQNKKASDYTKTSLWTENFAAKIDQLSQANVDPDMVKYAYATATNLRLIAGSLRGVPVKVNAAAAGLDVRVNVAPLGYRRVYYFGWRYVPVYGAMASSNSADVAAKQAAVIAEDSLARDSIWSAMAEDRRRIQRLMYDRYKLTFDAIK